MERATQGLCQMATARNLVLVIILSAVSVTVMGILTQTLVYGVYGDADMPDTLFSYTITEITEAFNTLGSEGLRIWLQVHLIDLIFPIGYSFSLAFAIALEVKASDSSDNRLRYLVWIPIFAALADYIENALVASQAIAYPNLSQSIIAFSSGVTSLKWVLLYIAFSLVFVLFVYVIYTRKRG